MAFSFTLTELLQTPEGVLSQPVTSTGSGVQAIDDTIDTAITDQLVNVAFALTVLKCFYFLSDQDVTLETNAADHTGGDSIAIQANKPLVWQSGGYLANPFAFAVTKIYLTNASGSTANYSCRVLTDATP